MTVKEAEILCIRILKQVMEEKLSSNNVQLAVVTPETGFKLYEESAVESIIADL